MKIKKIATVLAGALMVGATMGTAAAASYPSQIVSSGTVVVVGTDGAEASDQAAATAIQADLQAEADASALTGATMVTGGETFLLDKSSTHIQFGDDLNKVYTKLNKENMDFLADGSYDDGDVDEDYDQEIVLSDLNMTQFSDKDFDNENPTIGWMFEKNDLILNYTMTFDSSVNLTKMIGTDMPLLGAEYYVLDTDSNTITLLDSADTTILSEEDESVTVDGKEVSIEFLSDDGVKLTVDGETTSMLEEGETFQLKDDSYVAITEILTSSRETVTQKVEFSIGAGKVILDNGKEVIMGEDSDDDIDGLVAYLDTSGSDQIESLTLSWKASKDTFLAKGNAITMPGFDVLGLTFNGLNYPDDSEIITIESGETLMLSMGNYDLPVVSWNDTDVLQGEEDYKLVISGGNVTYDEAGYADGTTPFFESAAIVNTSKIVTNGLTLEEDQRFIVTSLDDDLSDVETHYYEVTDITVDDDETFTVTLEDLIGDDDITFDEDDMTEDVEETTVTLEGFNSDNDTIYLAFSVPGTLAYNKAVSETGLIVRLPSLNDTAFGFTEADEDGDLNKGDSFNASVMVSKNDKVYVSYSGSSNEQEDSDDQYVDVIQSALASIVKTDESGDEYEFEIEYFGEEVTADVSVVAGGEVTSDDSEIDVKVVDDTADVSEKNIVVVGGNCVNAIARDLLGLTGGDSCMAEFESETGASDGNFLIKSFDNDGKIALLVAGYSAADTTKAKNALLAADNLDVSVGKAYMAESTTTADATLVAA